MKPTTILYLAVAAITTTATASNVHEVADLVARAIDPATMDPTKFSVLSVLRTAMPTPTGTETDIVLPTGDTAPQWYKDLPADVMVLLAQMYPATPTAAASETKSSAGGSSPSEVQDSSAFVTASATASQTTLTKALEAASVTLSASACWPYSNGSVSTGCPSVVVSTGSLSPNVTGIMGGTTATASSTGAPTGKPGLELSGTSAGAKSSILSGKAIALLVAETVLALSFISCA